MKLLALGFLVVCLGCAKSEDSKPAQVAAEPTCTQASIDAFGILGAKVESFQKANDVATATEVKQACDNYIKSLGSLKSCSAADKTSGQKKSLSLSTFDKSCKDASAIVGENKHVGGEGQNPNPAANNPSNEAGGIPGEGNKLEVVDNRIISETSKGLRLTIKNADRINEMLAGGPNVSMVRGEVIKDIQRLNSDLGFCFLRAGEDFGQAKVGQVIELPAIRTSNQTIVFLTEDSKLAVGCGKNRVKEFSIQDIKEVFADAATVEMIN